MIENPRENTMKKVLFATTALIATAGMAAADVTIGGYGRFGFVYTDTAGVTDTNLENRINLDIKATGEAGNLSFGGKIRMRGNGGSVATLNGVQVSMSTGGLTIYAGNVPGLLDSMANAYNTVGYTGGTFQAFVGNGAALAYSSQGAGANALQANYSMGSFEVALAHGDAADATQARVTYSGNGLTVSAAVQDGGAVSADVTAITAAYEMGSMSVNVGWGDADGVETTQIGLSASLGAATSVNAYVSDRDGAAETAFGLGLNHDLGGASVGFGYETLFSGDTRAEMGIKFNF